MSKWIPVLEKLGAGVVGEIVDNHPSLQAAITEERGATPATKLDWLPILVELGEEIVARLLDKSPDAASAIAAAHEEFEKAEAEAAALRAEGHEGQ